MMDISLVTAEVAVKCRGGPFAGGLSIWLFSGAEVDAPPSHESNFALAHA